jgi:predicted dehydrogenase
VEDYRELINDPEIDVICVATPNRYHKEHLIAAIQAGKHIYCDKPAVTSVEEAEAVEAALKASNYQGKTQMAFHNRFFPAILRAKQLINDGFLGRVFHYRGAYLHASNIDPNRPLGWKSSKELGGGGSLVDLGSHLTDMMQFLLGEVKSVYAVTETFIHERLDAKTGQRVAVDTDDLALMTVRHESGALGTLEATKFATGMCDELRFEIHGELGAIRFNLMNPNWLEVYDVRDASGPIGGMRGFKRIECVQQYPAPASGFPAPKVSVGWIRGHMHCMYSFLESIALDREPSPNLTVGLRLQRMLAAAYQSAESGTAVNVN